MRKKASRSLKMGMKGKQRKFERGIKTPIVCRGCDDLHVRDYFIYISEKGTVMTIKLSSCTYPMYLDSNLPVSYSYSSHYTNYLLAKPIPIHCPESLGFHALHRSTASSTFPPHLTSFTSILIVQ